MTSHGHVPERLRVGTWNGWLALDKWRAGDNTRRFFEIRSDGSSFVEPMQCKSKPNDASLSAIIDETGVTQRESDIILCFGAYGCNVKHNPSTKYIIFFVLSFLTVKHPNIDLCDQKC